MVKKKKVVLITGAGSGLGKVIAQYLAMNGHHVIGTDVNTDHLTSLESSNITTGIIDVTRELTMPEFLTRFLWSKGASDGMSNFYRSMF